MPESMCLTTLSKSLDPDERKAGCEYLGQMALLYNYTKAVLIQVEPL